MNINPRLFILAILPITCAIAATPVLTYATYFGTSMEQATAMAVAPTGELVLVGSTTSQTLPGTSQVYQSTRSFGFPFNKDVFIAKFDATGRQLLWATFLGGDTNDEPTGVAVDQSGNVLVTGTSNSTNFPSTSTLNCSSSSFAVSPQKCTVSPSPSPQTAAAATFLAKISSDGRQLLSSITFPTSQAFSHASFVNLILDSQNGVFAILQAAQGTYLMHFASGGNLIFGSYLPGFDNNYTALSLASDSSGNCYVAGSTLSAGLTTTPNALQAAYSNSGLASNSGDVHNGYLMELDVTGSKVLYGTYFGPKYFSTLMTGMTLVNNALYITGGTTASTLGATAGAYLTAAPNQSQAGQSGYLMKLIPGAPAPSSLTYLGTPGRQVAVTDIARVLTYDGFIELNPSSLALLNAEPAADYLNFAVTPQATWIAGNCMGTFPCPTGLPSADAYQATGDTAFLFQFMDQITAVTTVVNAASLQNGPLAPGQLATVFGTLLGPPVGAGGQFTGGAFGTSAGGTQAFFDGIPAPIFYAQSGQVNLSIPCALAGHTATQLIVKYNGVSSSPLSVPLTISAPGIFTVNGSGIGPAAAFNQDFSLNTAANPALRGSAVVVFATGLPGPACSDGQILPAANSIAVTGGIDNKGAQALYAGQAPTSVSGLQQVNLVVPADSAVGPSIYLVLAADNQFSRAGVTIAVK
jgi:uncharacterized protein (TIGR03437 family)